MRFILGHIFRSLKPHPKKEKNVNKDLIRQKECEDYGFRFIRYKDKVPTKLELMGDIKKIQYWI